MYDVSAAINNVDLIKLPLNPNFQIDVATLKPYISDATIKLIFICSPNNPTGNLIDFKTIDYILNNFNGIVIIDEAYIDFSTCDSLINLVQKYDNLIVSQTFSKAWGLAAARVGTAYANKEIISLYNKVKPPYNVSELNQKAAIKALHNQEIFNTNLKIIIEEKKQLREALNGINIVKKVYPSDANFLLIEVNDANTIYTTLVHQKIIIRNRNKQVKNCIRISVGTPEENQKLITALKNLA